MKTGMLKVLIALLLGVGLVGCASQPTMLTESSAAEARFTSPSD